MELFPKDSVVELSTKKLGTLTALKPLLIRLFVLQFGSYGILMIDVTAEFRFWIEQRQNGSSISSLGLAKTMKVSIAIW